MTHPEMQARRRTYEIGLAMGVLVPPTYAISRRVDDQPKQPGRRRDLDQGQWHPADPFEEFFMAKAGWVVLALVAAAIVYCCVG